MLFSSFSSPFIQPFALIFLLRLRKKKPPFNPHQKDFLPSRKLALQRSPNPFEFRSFRFEVWTPSLASTFHSKYRRPGGKGHTGDVKRGRRHRARQLCRLSFAVDFGLTAVRVDETCVASRWKDNETQKLYKGIKAGRREARADSKTVLNRVYFAVWKKPERGRASISAVETSVQRGCVHY